MKKKQDKVMSDVGFKVGQRVTYKDNTYQGILSPCGTVVAHSYDTPDNVLVRWDIPAPGMTAGDIYTSSVPAAMLELVTYESNIEHNTAQEQPLPVSAPKSEGDRQHIEYIQIRNDAIQRYNKLAESLSKATRDYCNLLRSERRWLDNAMQEYINDTDSHEDCNLLLFFLRNIIEKLLDEVSNTDEDVQTEVYLQDQIDEFEIAMSEERKNTENTEHHC